MNTKESVHMQQQKGQGALSMQQQSNKGFTKVNNEFLDSPHFTGVSNTAFRIYVMIRRFSNGLYKPCYPSQSLLAEKTGQSKDTIKRGVAELVEKGFLHAQKNRTGSNIYTFPLELSFEQGANLHGAGGKSAPSHESAKPPIARPPEKVSSGLGQGANLHPKQEVLFSNNKQTTKKELVSMSKKTFQDDFSEVKHLSPDGLTSEQFTEAYNKALGGFIKNYSLDRADDCLVALGRKGEGYQQKLILLAGLIAHGYSQETIDNPPDWALSEFKKHQAKEKFLKPINAKFILRSSEAIYSEHTESIQRSQIVEQRIKADQLAKAKAVLETQALASQAPPEIVKQAERKYNREDYPGEMAGKVRQRLVEAEIVELMKLKGVA